MKTLSQKVLNQVRISQNQYDTYSKKIGCLGSLIRSNGQRTWLTYGLYKSIPIHLDNNIEHDGLIRARDQVLAFEQDDRPYRALTPEIGHLRGFIDDDFDHFATVVGARILSTTSIQLSPESRYSNFFEEIKNLKIRRSKLARTILLYYFERAFVW